MNKSEIRLSIFASILVILDVVGRNVPREHFKLLINPIFSINILEIFIILLIIIIAYKFIPPVLFSREDIKRSEKFYNNWKEFKSVLLEYSNSPSSVEKLQKKYGVLREKLEEDFNYFATTIRTMQMMSHRQYNDLAIQNFENTFSPREITTWQDKIKRRIPDELDCFDYFLLSLKEYYKNPKHF